MVRAKRGPSHLSALRRVVIAIALGLVVGPLLSALVPWQAAGLLGWDATAVCFLLWVWLSIWGLSPSETREVAVREDPSVALADSVVLFAGVACLGAVALVLIKAGSSHGSEKALLIAVGVGSVAASWAALHTTFTLRYARIFYTGSVGGISFNEKEPPDYVDFAYVALTIGLTFQVSDTDLSSKVMRRTALRHALLSYLFGAVIVALTINVVASLLSNN
jgi:uncharacterized membrane protein